METYRRYHGRYLPFIFICICCLFSLGAFFVFAFSYSPLAGAAILLAPLSIFITNGIEVDIANRRYRDYINLYGYRRGTWLPVDDIDYISMYTASYSQTVTSRSNNATTVRLEQIAVQMIRNGRERVLIDDFSDKEQALRAAAYLSHHLKIEVLDATTAENEWLGVM